MKPVKEITIVLVDFEVISGPGEGENNITDEMRQKWGESFKTVETVLVDAGITPDNSAITRDEHFMDVMSDEDITLEYALEILKALEEHFEVAEFTFSSEGDDFYEEPPHVKFCIHEKE